MARIRKKSGIYGGRSTQQRQAERRCKLIDAALQIWHEQGWAAVSMRGVCARAGLIDRYFYENFADREALLAAAWDQVRDEMLSMLLASISDIRAHPPLVQLRTAITALVRQLVDDPGRAQILFSEHAGSPLLEQRRQHTLQQATDVIADLARPFLAPGIDEDSFRMTVLMGIGGFYELITAWRAGIVTASADQIINQSAQFGDTLGAQYLSDHSTESLS